MMSLEFDLLRRRVRDRRFWFSLPSLLCIFGMALGVACLTASMALVSGFEKTLRVSVQDIYSHIVVLKRFSSTSTGASNESTIQKMRSVTPELRAITPFLQLEGLIAGNGKIAGVLLQGIDPKTYSEVLKLEPRIIFGEVELGDVIQPKLLIGKGLQKKFDVKIGQELSFVLPVTDPEDAQKFTTRTQKFIVAGVLDLGKNDYNERLIVTDLAVAQNIAREPSEFISGWRMRLKDANSAEMVAARLDQSLGPNFFISTWVDSSRNLFEAIRVEKPVLFVIISVMVIAAAFNLASHLFLSVYRRYSDISILSVLGMRPWQTLRLYVFEGMVFSVAGLFFGILLGGVFCLLFLWAQKTIVLLPADVYRVENVGVDIRWIDLIGISGAALLISLIAVVFPARKAASLSPVEGLRYE